MLAILLVIVLLVIAAAPPMPWSYRFGFGWGPSGLLGAILIVLLLYVLLGGHRYL